MKHLLSLLVLCLSAASVLAQRQTIDLPDGWKFIKHDAAPDLSTDSPDWQSITVPHCFNALDGQNGNGPDGGYYRGPTWYQRTLDAPANWQERRVFIRFEGAFLVSEVYLNGEKLGEHRGGFAAFCYELTPKLKFGAANDLRVRVNNAKNSQVAPLSADFTMEGGIYRPVHLIVTGKTCITPLDYAGPGVYVTPRIIDAEHAELTVVINLAHIAGPPDDTFWRLVTVVSDAEGKQVSGEVSILRDPTQPVQISLSIPQPHRWNGIKDPYLYSVETTLFRGPQGNDFLQRDDSVTVPFGFRTVSIDKDKGFLLNGEPYPIHGVNRHQERKDKGWALTDADHDEDFATMREMGVTAVRLAHYQQAEHVHDIADKTGMLLWQEIPLVDYISTSDTFAENARLQLTEMIRQGYNHPSIFTWSLFNELVHPKSPPPEALIASLDKLARELDPTRTPASASCRPDLPPLNRITEWIGFNIYPGWYVGTSDGFGPPEDFDRNVKKSVLAAGGNKRVSISEYGAGANPAQHQEGVPMQVKPGGPFHPEEWQTHVHEVAWSQMRNHPGLWGTFIWAMFDFAVDGRNEGSTAGINDKGMVTQDRQTKKDTFFFYKANWNPEPMVYLTSRRATRRTVSKTQIKAYTNLDEADLKVNGKSVGTVKPSEIRVLLWPEVTLQPGVNVVEVTAHGADGKTLIDRCEWTLEEPAAAPSPVNTP